ALSREIAALSDTIRATEKQLRDDDVSFLLNYKAAVERVQQRPLLDAPQLHSGALIDMATHVGNLRGNILYNIASTNTPVILDPNTAHPQLILSEDLTCVRFGEKQKLPDNPERFNFYCSVLGTEGFKSGNHSWDVEVGDNEYWLVGAAAESIQRKECPQSGLWTVTLFRNEYKAQSLPNHIKALQLKKKPQSIRVHLRYADTKAHIHTFKLTFTERVFPFICSGDVLPMRIMPEKLFECDDDDNDE
ncbi:hypothetical protein LDENG_00105260, partial [Lucifuga dentata]